MRRLGESKTLLRAGSGRDRLAAQKLAAVRYTTLAKMPGAAPQLGMCADKYELIKSTAAYTPKPSAMLILWVRQDSPRRRSNPKKSNKSPHCMSRTLRC